MSLITLLMLFVIVAIVIVAMAKNQKKNQSYYQDLQPNVSSPSYVSVEKGFCQYCGKELVGAGVFCQNCGARQDKHLETAKPFSTIPQYAPPTSKKNTRRAVLISVISLVVVAAIIITSVVWIVPTVKYYEAMKLYDNKQYDSAYRAFNALHYKDSNYMAHEAAIRSRFDVIKFGKYEWIILEAHSNAMLVLTKDIVNFLPFNEVEGSDINWSNCSLRSWLNGQFYNSFSDSDKNNIFPTSMNTQTVETFSNRGIVNTNDYVFLLSADEFNSYFKYSSSDYYKAYYSGKADGLLFGTNTYYGWWLRSRSVAFSDDSTIDCVGKSFDKIGNYKMTFPDRIGVRPAMWISLSVLSTQ